MMIAAAIVALIITGSVSATFGAIVFAVIVTAYLLENTGWQISERVGLGLAILSLAAGGVIWNQGYEYFDLNGEHARQQFVTYLLIWLTLIKVVQRKAERDWIFLYALSFFEILFAAGSRFDSRMFALFVVYVLAALCAGITGEIRRAARVSQSLDFSLNSLNKETNNKETKTSWRESSRFGVLRPFAHAPAGRLFVIALAVFVLVVAFALPIFFLAPRFTRSSALARSNMSSGSGGGNTIGYADKVNLGNIGRLQQSSEIVMRVRVENLPPDFREVMRWRGSAFDTFDGYSWRRFQTTRFPAERSEGDLYKISVTKNPRRLVRQTFFVEPTDTAMLFAAPRLVAVEGTLPFVLIDTESGAQARPHPNVRLTYRAYSDFDALDANDYEQTVIDDASINTPANARYLQLPANFNPRIRELAKRVSATATNDYERSRLIESYLRDNFAYSFDMRATGEDPLSDFLFRVRAGHCEYFASAMTLMLRSLNIPARVATGFQTGEYNDAADAYIVRQNNAHAWTEVYFPNANQWTSFDSTPPANPANENANGDSWLASFSKYSEAAELAWLQYVVTYGKQEQQWLARNLSAKLNANRANLKTAVDEWSVSWRDLKESLSKRKNSDAAQTNQSRYALAEVLAFAGLAILALVLYLNYKRKTDALKDEAQKSVSECDFYARMIASFEARGVRRDKAKTPREFAQTIKTEEATYITEAFERVRYGKASLTEFERKRVEDYLKSLEDETASTVDANRKAKI